MAQTGQFKDLNALIWALFAGFPRLETTMNRSREHVNDLTVGRQPEASARALSPTAVSRPGLLLALRLTRP